MIYPQFIKKGETIGISALSAGVGEKIESYLSSLAHLKEDYLIKESASVRNKGLRAERAEIRASEFNRLYGDRDVKLMMMAAGGDFLLETLDKIDYKAIVKEPKWLIGASDPTSLLYYLTTAYDIATLYGFNAGSFAGNFPYITKALGYLKGELKPQCNYHYYQSTDDFIAGKLDFTLPVQWKSSSAVLKVKGRLLGGCLDVLKDIIGTEYDATAKFMARYRDEGIIWYFDNFALSAESFYRTLLQFRYAGYFRTCKAILVGRTLFPQSETGMDYQEALKLAFKDVPYLYDIDIGHTLPKMILINGAILTVDYQDGQGKFNFTLK